ncbi:hypothetical protein SY88_08455 [Clostridiales bacterium PH28_bin88]|nr:hypothetical protein SY88_08455 [Clostridiales bacterium PH28_bin88]
MGDRDKCMEGCMVCGRELVYAARPTAHTCVYCGRQEEAYLYCPAGHYVCDACHRQDAIEAIKQICLASDSRDPLFIADAVMDLPFVPMHGPEHHALVPAALVAAWANSLGLPKDGLVAEAIKRGGSVPGGVCGRYGACGAGIGVGVGVSVMLAATPMSGAEWGLANQVTAVALASIGRQGGPRCCKRTTRLALLAAMDFLRDRQGVTWSGEAPGKKACRHHRRNRQCQLAACPFYPA